MLGGRFRGKQVKIKEPRNLPTHVFDDYNFILTLPSSSKSCEADYFLNISTRCAHFLPSPSSPVALRGVSALFMSRCGGSLDSLPDVCMTRCGGSLDSLPDVCMTRCGVSRDSLTCHASPITIYDRPHSSGKLTFSLRDRLSEVDD